MSTMTWQQFTANLVDGVANCVRFEFTDFREARDFLEELATLILKLDKEKFTLEDMKACRDELGVCTRSGRHTTDICDKDCEDVDPWDEEFQ